MNRYNKCKFWTMDTWPTDKTQFFHGLCSLAVKPYLDIMLPSCSLKYASQNLQMSYPNFFFDQKGEFYLDSVSVIQILSR